MSREDRTPEITIDAEDLYREELFTDGRAGTLRRLTPVKTDASDDPSRKVLYVGQAQLLTPMGALPLSFDIEADSLDSALQQYASAAEQAMERAMQELQEMRREAASSLVIPEGGPGGMGGGMGGPGGKIQLR